MRLYQHQPSGTVPQLRALRRNATDAELALRRALRTSLPDLKWRFQAPIDPFRVDFLCFAERLIIEVDGGQHAQAQDYDAARTRYLEQQGYRILRFWNNEVLENIAGVLTTIANSLSPREREGAAQRRKGEGDQLPADTASPSPSHAASRRAPPLPKGEV